VPAPLAERWDAYAAEFKKLYKLDGAKAGEVDSRLARAKERTARWVLDVPEYVGSAWPKPPVADRVKQVQDKTAEAKAAPDNTALKAEADALRAGLQKDLDKRTDEMKQSLAVVLPQEQQDGLAPAEKSTKMLAVVDWMTRWGLA